MGDCIEDYYRGLLRGVLGVLTIAHLFLGVGVTQSPLIGFGTGFQ